MFKNITVYLLIAAMIATALTLVIGVFTMFTTKTKRKLDSNRLMRLRILLQATALALLALLLFMGR